MTDQKWPHNDRQMTSWNGIHVACWSIASISMEKTKCRKCRAVHDRRSLGCKSWTNHTIESWKDEAITIRLWPWDKKLCQPFASLRLNGTFAFFWSPMPRCWEYKFLWVWSFFVAKYNVQRHKCHTSTMRWLSRIQLLNEEWRPCWVKGRTVAMWWLWGL